MRTTVFYEAPHRLLKTIRLLRQYAGNRRVALCKELTKKFEKVWLTTLDEAETYYGAHEAKGEYVLVLEGADARALEKEARREWQEMSLEDHMALYTDQGLSRKDAMKAVAKDRGMAKRDIYQLLVKEE